jgi:hypothetical protein
MTDLHLKDSGVGKDRNKNRKVAANCRLSQSKDGKLSKDIS